MDTSAPTNLPLPTTTTTSPPLDPAALPPAALALASRLFTAARTGDTALIAQVLPLGLSPNLTNDKGDSLIMLASYHGHVELVRLLLSHGADPNRLNDRGQSPLAGVVFKGERECVRVLLGGGADPMLGTPSALEACRVFRQEEVEGWFLEKMGGNAEGEGEKGGAGGGGEM